MGRREGERSLMPRSGQRTPGSPEPWGWVREEGEELSQVGCFWAVEQTVIATGNWRKVHS